jgi:hypothetical protein
MTVKCMNCETLWDKKTEEEKCCENCACQTVCPKCGCNAWVPMEKNENVESKKQTLLFD